MIKEQAGIAAESWREVQPGFVVKLSDNIVRNANYVAGKGDKVDVYTVSLVRRITQRESHIEWLFFRLEENDHPLWLLAKIIDQKVTLAVLAEPQDLISGNRQELINRQEYWLFQEPNDPDHIVYDELDFATEIYWVIDNPNGSPNTKDITYRMKEQGVLYGLATHIPPLFTAEPVVGVVIEYSTEDDPDNPEVVIMEIGGEEGEYGGKITVLFGAPILSVDVQVSSPTGKSVVKIEPQVVEREGFFSSLKKKLGL